MANDVDMASWSDLLHSSSKLLQQAVPSRNLHQLEALSKKIKAKTARTEARSQSIAATRLLAREGINAEQLARDLKLFELKTTFEDVFPAEATTVEEYLQQKKPFLPVTYIGRPAIGPENISMKRSPRTCIENKAYKLTELPVRTLIPESSLLHCRVNFKLQKEKCN